MRCTLSGNRLFLAVDLYRKFNRDSFTFRDCKNDIKPLQLKSLHQEGVLDIVQKGNNDRPHVYRISSPALMKLEQLGDDTFG